MSSGSSVYTIDTGKSRGTTFKIDTGGYVFSCLFDSGAEISCMNMETIAALGLTSQITPSSVSVNTANGDHMGVAGNVRVHFKIGKKCSFTHSFVVCERLSCPFIIGEDFMRKHYMSLQWVPENKRALGFQGETIAVASQAILDEPLRLRNAIRIPPRSTVMAPGYCNQMFSGKAAAVPCAELRQRFPNLYMEPMQMNNSENKSYDTIPYMLINLGDVDTIYIGRDTLIAYIKGEDASCEYLEVNEIIEDVWGINWQPPRTRKMVTSDLVYSLAQVTEHRCVELKDHDISEDTRRKFEELKVQFPKVFSLNNEDIGHTQLVTMDIDTGDSPPICQKPYTLPLKHYNWVQQEIETLERAGVIRKSISLWASPIVIVPKKSAPGEPPHRRMCIDFRKLNDLQPEVRRADSQTGGNISLVPLPKIDEMYGRLKGAKYFTTLDLRSGYYHIGLSKGSKAKTAFVTPFGKYQFEVVPFGLAQAPAYFQQLISMVLQDCSEFAMAYLDDIIIFSRNEREHLKHIQIIFQKLIDAGLKLKESKCDFFKKEIHYLGHLISSEGIHPLPEKLDTIHNMPRPKTPKEIKQFLGLCGYYRKFVPRFSDIARPLSKLTAHDAVFVWCEQCELSFQMLKDTLVSAPILKYPDTSKPYTIFTDASKYGWAGVLMQEHTSVLKGKETTTKHPVAYVSGLFRGSQLNWAAMTKEAYAIYMTVKKSTFYITGHDVTLRSDHLPLNKFLKQMTLNNTVNNWAMEIESFKIKFVHIAGKDNVLADTLSRLIDIDPDVELQPE